MVSQVLWITKKEQKGCVSRVEGKAQIHQIVGTVASFTVTAAAVLSSVYQMGQLEERKRMWLSSPLECSAHFRPSPCGTGRSTITGSKHRHGDYISHLMFHRFSGVMSGIEFRCTTCLFRLLWEPVSAVVSCVSVSSCQPPWNSLSIPCALTSQWKGKLNFVLCLFPTPSLRSLRTGPCLERGWQ